MAAVSLSWGGAAEYPARYQAGVKEIESRFGLQVVPMPNALKSADFIYQNPKARAKDLMQAFADPEIKAVFSIIGGDDSLRIVPFLQEQVFKQNPKPFLGYSDSTVVHLYLNKLGIPSFYGPAIMAGFAENGGMFAYTEHAVRQVLFEPQHSSSIPKHNGEWSNSPPDFNLPYAQKRPTNSPLERFCLQGTQVVEGKLLGGCFEALDFCRGTPIWPTRAQWQGVILCLEIAEGDKATQPHKLSWFLRSLAADGVLAQLNGIVLGRIGEQVPPERYADYEQALVKVLAEEKLCDLPVLSRFEFGHTDPMCVLTLGGQVKLVPSSCDLVVSIG